MAEIHSFEEAQIKDFYGKLYQDRIDSKDTVAVEYVSKAEIELKAGKYLSFEDTKPVIRRAVAIGVDYASLSDHLLEQIAVTIKPMLALKQIKDARQKVDNFAKQYRKELLHNLNKDSGALDLKEQYIRKFVMFPNGRECTIYDIDGEFPPVSLTNFKLRHDHKELYDERENERIGMGTYLLKYTQLRIITGFTNQPDNPHLITKPTSITGEWNIVVNNWKGFSVAESPPIIDPEKKCALFLHHLKIGLCNGDSIAYQSLIVWLAHMIQKPTEKPGICVLSIGLEGVGKDLAAAYISKMIHPSHVNTALMATDIAGEFNRLSFENKLFVCLSELPVLNKEIGILNNYITNPIIVLNDKNAPRYSMNCMMRWFLSTNKENAISMTSNTRRQLVIHASDHWANQAKATPEQKEARKQYFTKIVEEMENDGPAALYQYLMSIDISNIQIQHIDLDTSARQDVVELSRSAMEIFIDEHIMGRGVIPAGVNFGEIPLNLDTETIIVSDMIKDSYACMIDNNREFRSESRRLMPKKFIMALGLPWEGTKNNWKHYKLMSGKGNSCQYIFPPLSLLREIWAKK